MQFILSKLLAIFLSPANWLVILLLLLVVVRSKTWKKRIAITTIILALVFTNPWLFRLACLNWQPARQKLSGQYEVAILPGGLSGYDKFGNGYFGQAADRFIQATQLYHLGQVKYILVTGGNGHLDRSYPAEAIFLRQELVANGIAADHILIDAKSRNTRENAAFSKLLYDSMHFSKPAILVTSALHMPRCQLEFNKVGLKTIAFPANYEVIPERISFGNLLWPDPALTNRWTAVIKEWVGYFIRKLN